MNYQLLGRSGLRVSDLCLGTMTFGEDWGWGSSQDEARKIYDAYRAAGGNFLDTANIYTNGSSEKLVGEFVQGHREEVVIATKYTNAVVGFSGKPGTDANAGGNHRKNMVQAVEASLKRLGTDYIDLYWLHCWDGVTPAEEVMRAFDDLVRAARDERKLSANTAWGPLRSGLLTGKYLPENIKQSEAEGARMHSDMMKGFGSTGDEATHALVREVVALGQELGVSSSQVALAWLRAQAVPTIPIIGARKLAQVEDNIASVNVTLSAEQIARLDKASAVPLGFPHDFLSQASVRNIVFGGLRDRIKV